MTTRKWGSEFLVNTTTASSQQGSSVAALPDGGFVMTWVDFTINGSLIRWQRFDATGAKVGTEQTSATPFGNQNEPTVTLLSDGNLWIANTDFDSASNDNVVGNVYSLDGVFLRAQNLNTGGLDHQNVDIAPLLAGSIAVYENTLRDAGGAALHSDIIMKGFDATGVVNIAEQVVHGNADLSRTNPQVAVNPVSSRFVVTWSQNQDIFARVFTSAGAPLVAEFAVNTTLGAASSTEVTWLNDEEFVTVWVNQDNFIANGGDGSSNAVKFMICNAFGSPIGTERLVNTTTQQDQRNPAVTVLPGGGFAVAWQDSSTLSADNSDFAVRLQAFNGLGEKLGGEILVNTTTAGAQEAVQLATLEDGRVIVTWTDSSATGGDTSDRAVRAQIVDPRDGIIDGTSGIDKLYGHDNVGDIMTGFAGADTMFGLAGADTLEGNAGADQLFGDRGDDTLLGGIDADILMGGIGADVIFGDAGNDTITFVQSRAGVTVNLETGDGFGAEAEGDTYNSIELVRGSNFGDTLIASNLGSTLTGFAGVDTLNGGSAADTFNGGDGADIITGGGGTDIAFYSSTSAAITINLFTNANSGGEALGDVLTSIENISGTSQGDTILGNSLNNTFFGGLGNDRLGGGTGVDTLISGGGSDTFVFALGDTGQTLATSDIAFDYTKGVVGTGDKIDFTSALSVGGVATAATATQASINATTGVATFFAGSGTTMADALADIAQSLTTGVNTAGEFALFRVNNTGNFFQFISDGVAGVGVNDVLVDLRGITTINTINLTAGDLTILT